jgi:hypothetical protein
MLFDNFDKKIKEAAEQHHPAYDENAWRKMENLLNQHLPQQKDRRRFFLLAFTILLFGGGVFFLLSKPNAKNSDQVVQETKSSTSSKTQADKTDKNTTIAQPGIDNTNKEIINDNTVGGAASNIAGRSDDSPVAIGKEIVAPGRWKQKVDKNELLLNNAINDHDKNVADETQKKNDVVQLAPVPPRPDERIVKNESPVNDPLAKESNVANNTQQVQGSSAKKTAPKNGRPDRKNGFSFFVSTGPDVSKAQNSKAGKITMSWGLGVAYTLNRLTLKAGVFSANKIYWAGPDDYKLSYTPPPTLKFMGADANCRVIEIPVKLSYDFAVKNRSSWFAGAGLSSYLMKREDYLYEYKSNTGNSYYHSYETKNENKHYFSVLNLSGGYTYRLSNTISMSAEPYVEVPLTGIGMGKVHLNSGRILFTVGVHPFRK